MADIEKLKDDACKAVALYCNEKMWADMGIAMPEFAKTQAITLIDCLDNAMAKNKEDQRFPEIKSILTK